ncbi:hypothetical protein M405DRAFT_811931 [Rhizopogon salebrosus TDB-379]|nr:hypothetical protein M405DRAFT_811931 [Rhizopogon salebrosus TDB-379]
MRIRHSMAHNTAGIHFRNVNNRVVLLIDQLAKTFADSMTISEPLERDRRARSSWALENGTAPSGNKLEDTSDSTFWNKACHCHIRVRVPRKPSSVALASDTIKRVFRNLLENFQMTT